MHRSSLHGLAAAAYRSAETEPPVLQVALLCARAVEHLEAAKAAIATRRVEARFERVMQAHAIVGGLQACLDFRHGGEIAPLLDRLYGYMLGRLTQINLRKDPAICEELIGLLGRMRSSWAEIAAGTPASQPPLRPDLAATVSA